MATTADFQKGLCLVFNQDLFIITYFQHVKPGKGGAFVRTKLKSVNSGKIIDHTFRAGASVDTARIERHPHQFLYADESGYHFMHQETFEQILLEKALLDQAHLMKTGMEVSILFHAEQNKPLTCELPAHVQLEVTYTEPGIKGDTATTALKPAPLETGAQVQVPLFIQQGETIQIDTRTEKYLSRVKA